MESVPAGPVSPEYARRLRREAWASFGTEFGSEVGWEAGREVVTAALDIDLPGTEVIRQAVADIPVAVATVAQFLNRIGKQR